MAYVTHLSHWLRRHRTYQKAMGQAIIQKEHNTGNIAECREDNEGLVSKGSTIKSVTETREFSVVDVGNGLDLETSRSGYCDEREHGHSVSNESPLGTPFRAVGGIEQRAHALEELNDDDP